jgi:tyrosine-protein phosphatase SIW14
MAQVLSAAVTRRTSLAARWRRGGAWWLLLAAGLAVLAAGGQMLLSRQHLKRFHVVRPGVWYRTAQPSQWSLSWLVRRHGVRTVLCLRHFEEIPLRGGLLDFDGSNGVNEADYVRDQLGLNFVQWPMGDEPYWPWCTPKQFEALFRLVDDPNNHPIVVHCVGGRHRTGTMTALFRMEYDRWSPDDALAEMYSVDFGHSMAIQDHNLRTYLPRPQPGDAASRALQERLPR